VQVRLDKLHGLCATLCQTLSRIIMAPAEPA
jgi:hypothetical protein